MVFSYRLLDVQVLLDHLLDQPLAYVFHASLADEASFANEFLQQHPPII